MFSCYRVAAGFQFSADGKLGSGVDRYYPNARCSEPVVAGTIFQVGFSVGSVPLAAIGCMASEIM